MVMAKTDSLAVGDQILGPNQAHLLIFFSQLSFCSFQPLPMPGGVRNIACYCHQENHLPEKTWHACTCTLKKPLKYMKICCLNPHHQPSRNPKRPKILLLTLSKLNQFLAVASATICIIHAAGRLGSHNAFDTGWEPKEERWGMLASYPSPLCARWVRPHR